jgi:DNA-binding IclR family transcriptional regulator
MAVTSGYRERNSTADRALTVLQMFSESRTEITAIDVAETLGVARSTAYRYLETLVTSGFLSETGRGGFRLGPSVLELARIARKGFGLAELCVPVMQELAEQFQQTVLLTKLMGNAVVCLEREEAKQQYVRLSYERGSILNINAGASALVLLSAMPTTQVRSLLESTPLARFTDNTLTEPGEILSRLEQIRLRGYALSVGEVDANAMGIAAPIYRSNGEVLAALSMVFIRTLIEDHDVDRIVEALVARTKSLTEQAKLLDL